MVKPTTRLETLQTSKLLQCVRQRHLAMVERLVVNGVPGLVDYNDPGADGVGDTALTMAASRNDLQLVELLLKHGACPDSADLAGRTALCRAADGGHSECVQLLVAAGAELDATDNEGRGVLFYCAPASQGHIDCATIVLRHNADTNLRAADGSSALQAACELCANDGQLCLLLLDYAADPNNADVEANKEGWTTSRTALMRACAVGNTKVVETLLARGARVDDCVIQSGRRAIHDAAASGHLPALQILSAYRAQMNVVDAAGNTPIHLAACNGHAACCKFLFQRGCNPKLKNSDGLSAQSLAKQSGKRAAAKECRRAEAAYGKPSGNVTPAWAIALYDFCYHRRQKLLDVFEQLDGDRIGRLDRKDFLDSLTEADTPLPSDSSALSKLLSMHEKDKLIDYAEFLTGKKYVTKKYRAEAFDSAKKRKKSRRRKRRNGRGRKTRVPVQICTRPEGARGEDGSPSDDFVPLEVYTTDSRRFDTNMRRPRHYLEDDSLWYLPPSDTSFIRINHAVKHSELGTLKAALTEQGQKTIDHRDRFYKTPLMVAASEGNLEVVQFLIANGADVKATDNFKWTPLHFACKSGRLDIIELLLDHDADLNATTLGGATPLMRAVESGRPEVVRLLIDRGADLRPINRKGKSAMHLAQTFADQRVYDIVRDKWNSLRPNIKNEQNAANNNNNDDDNRSDVTSIAVVRPDTTATAPLTC